MKKHVLVISGPSGSGKSTLINYLLSNLASAGLTTSCTTRSPREGERDGIDYHFISHAKFDELIAENEFIEYVECFGNKYGTLKSAIKKVFETHDVCILDLEFQGAWNVLSNDILNFDCKIIGILILPPSINTLRNRLINRKSETAESLDRRLNESFKPRRIAKYHHVIINRDLEMAQSELVDKLESCGIGFNPSITSKTSL